MTALILTYVPYLSSLEVMRIIVPGPAQVGKSVFPSAEFWKEHDAKLPPKKP